VKQSRIAWSAYRACPLILLLICPGCSLGPSRLARCRLEAEQLQQQLAEEQQLRQRQAAEMRELAERLAESEKQLAREFGNSLVERPRPLQTPRGRENPALIVPPPGQEPLDGGSQAAPPLDGWRPSRRSETVRTP
jgi:uncharacterized coiled-coil protein SlyX